MKYIASNFWLLIILLGALALFYPPLFSWLIPYLSYLLALVMLFMGITLQKEELISAFKNWRFALLGTFLQFLLMPLIAVILGLLFDFPIEYQLGLLLVGACPGGTASNVIVYLFKGDVSLSVLMTFMSTVLSVLLTPFIMEFYMGKQIDLPIQKMIQDIFILVILPLIGGFLIQKYISSTIQKQLKGMASYIALFVISLIIAAIVAVNAEKIVSMDLLLLVAVILHNGLGILGGYYLTRIFTRNVSIARTIAIEVGMQNSGLGVVLANLHFAKLVALPSAIFSFWHNISGILLANYWKNKA